MGPERHTSSGIDNRRIINKADSPTDAKYRSTKPTTPTPSAPTAKMKTEEKEPAAKSTTPSNPLRLRGEAMNLTRRDWLDTESEVITTTERATRTTNNLEQLPTRKLRRPPEYPKKSRGNLRSKTHKIQPQQSIRPTTA
ncbi:hypothetical protein N665_0338s0010 [Sinapis alba]|nr:hypothetical protein N665_0338s0010 [Sinapis alba]